MKAGSLDTGSAGTSGKAGSASGNFNGCAEVDAGLAVTGGADGKLFDIFDKSASVTLFQKNFNVLNVCIRLSVCRIAMLTAFERIEMLQRLWVHKEEFYSEQAQARS